MLHVCCTQVKSNIVIFLKKENIHLCYTHKYTNDRKCIIKFQDVIRCNEYTANPGTKTKRVSPSHPDWDSWPTNTPTPPCEQKTQGLCPPASGSICSFQQIMIRVSDHTKHVKNHQNNMVLEQGVVLIWHYCSRTSVCDKQGQLVS